MAAYWTYLLPQEDGWPCGTKSQNALASLPFMKAHLVKECCPGRPCWGGQHAVRHCRMGTVAPRGRQGHEISDSWVTNFRVLYDTPRQCHQMEITTETTVHFVRVAILEGYAMAKGQVWWNSALAKAALWSPWLTSENSNLGNNHCQKPGIWECVDRTHPETIRAIITFSFLGSK